MTNRGILFAILLMLVAIGLILLFASDTVVIH